MNIPQIQWYRGKPYFFYKIIHNKPNIPEFKKQIPGIRIYYIPTYNPRNKEKAYAIYLDKKITWY